MSKKKKRLLWLVLAVLILTGAALFSLLPRRAAAVLHLPNSTAGIHDITLSKKTPIGETGEAFVQNYTLTPDREAELVQEAYHWLASVRFRDLRFSTTEFGSGLTERSAAGSFFNFFIMSCSFTKKPPPQMNLTETLYVAANENVPVGFTGRHVFCRNKMYAMCTFNRK